MDSTIIFQQNNLAAFLRHDFHLDEEDGGGTVVQLGGFDPEDMANAAELVNTYRGARYTGWSKRDAMLICQEDRIII